MNIETSVVTPPFRLRDIAVAAFGPSLLFGLGLGAIVPVIALSARELGASVATSALIVTLTGIGSLVSNIPASLITMRHGERWAIVGAAVWGALAMALCAWANGLAMFAVGSFMIGTSQAVFSLARQSYLTEVVPVLYRARAMSLLGGALRIGTFVGPFIAALAIVRFGLAGAYGVGIATSVVAAAVGLRIPDLETPATVGANNAALSPTLASTLRDHRHLFVTIGVGVLLVSAVRATRQVVIPLWGDHLALDASTVSMIYGLSAALDLLVFYPAGKIMDTKGRSWVAVPCMVVMGVGLLLLPFAQGAATLLMTGLMIGLGNGIGTGIVLTLGADHSPRIGRAHFLGVWRLLGDLGTSCGPAVLSLLTVSLSLGAAIAVTGVVAFVAAAQLAYWIPRKHH